MARKLSEYEVNINGVKHTIQADAEYAESIGATAVKAAAAPANKAATPPAK